MNDYLKKLKEICVKESNYYSNSIDLIAASNFMRFDLAFPEFYRIPRSMEGLFGKRPYAGTKYLDEIEKIGIEAAKRVFNAEEANIQPHSGSQANQIAYSAFLKPNDTVLAMKFNEGGHLTHGNPINFSGQFYRFFFYGINLNTQDIDYDEIYKKAKMHKPKMIVAGASSYPRFIDYKKIYEIAKLNNSIFMVDIAHPIGLIAVKDHPSPFPYADIVTGSLEKTFAGVHAGIILAKSKHITNINRAVHPGVQSSVPIIRIIQATMSLLYAETREFKKYIQNVLKNAKILEKHFSKIDNCLLFGGTDTHFIVINTLLPFNLTGRDAEKILERLHIFTNRQVIPRDENRPYIASGLRMGTPAATQFGYNQPDFEIISNIIISALKDNTLSNLNRLERKIIKLVKNKFINYKYPLLSSED